MTRAMTPIHARATRPIRLASGSLVAAVLAAGLLAGCDGVPARDPAEQGAQKLAQIGRQAQALTTRIAASADLVFKSLPATEGGEAKELRAPLLGPADAAKELRTLAGQAASAGATDAQRKQGQELATRLRREAVVLELLELEQVTELQGLVAQNIDAHLALIRSIQSSGQLNATAPAEARLKATRKALEEFRAAVTTLRGVSEAATSELEKLDATVAARTAEASAIDAQAQALRSEAATSTASKAFPLVKEAMEKLAEAQQLRTDAATADMIASTQRAAIAVVSAAIKDATAGETFLGARLDAAEKAKQSAGARSEAARKRVEELTASATKLAKEYETLQTERAEPLAKSIAEALEGGSLATKVPTDAAMVALAKARMHALRIDALEQVLQMTAGADAETTKKIRAAQDAARAEAKTALVAAREALGGTDAGSGKAIVASVESIGQSLGVDLSTPAPKAEPAPDASAPAGDAPAASADPNADPNAAPAAAPEGDGAAPATPPAGKPAEPASGDEPNK
ncbi:MAG: hypothetical protein U0625_08730 [Phycisphaerales bacterium]